MNNKLVNSNGLNKGFLFLAVLIGILLAPITKILVDELEYDFSENKIEITLPNTQEDYDSEL